MTQKTPSARRDPRIAVFGGAGFVEFDSDGVRRRADLVDVSVAGMTFALDSGPRLNKGAVVTNATLHIGDCVVDGELLVKHSKPVRNSRADVGCLFFPSSQLGEEKLSAVLAGLQATRDR